MSTLFVLAGGAGSRLKPLVKDRPKALADIVGVPMLRHQLDCWSNQGVDDVVLLAGIMGDQIEDFVTQELGKHSKARSISISVIRELLPLGTGGAVLNAISKLRLDGQVIITNADTWLSSGMRDMALMSKNSVGVVQMTRPDRYGTVEFEDSRVVAFREKVAGLKRGFINAGVYSLNANVFRRFIVGSEFSLEQDVLPMLVREGALSAVQLETDFFDIGVPEDYQRFIAWFKSNPTK